MMLLRNPRSFNEPPSVWEEVEGLGEEEWDGISIAFWRQSASDGLQPIVTPSSLLFLIEFL